MAQPVALARPVGAGPFIRTLFPADSAKLHPQRVICCRDKDHRRWFIERQDLVTTFVTNLRAPDAPVWFAGAKVCEAIPLNVVAGNVAVAFAALSYAGQLTVTVIADTSVVPHVNVLAGALQKAPSGLGVNRVPAANV